MKHAPEDFEFVMEFEEYCNCHELKEGKMKECQCQVKREREQAHWDDMVKVIGKNRKKNKEGRREEEKLGKKIAKLKEAEFEELNYQKEFPYKDQRHQ